MSRSWSGREILRTFIFSLLTRRLHLCCWQCVNLSRKTVWDVLFIGRVFRGYYPHGPNNFQLTLFSAFNIFMEGEPFQSKYLKQLKVLMEHFVKYVVESTQAHPLPRFPFVHAKYSYTASRLEFSMKIQLHFAEKSSSERNGKTHWQNMIEGFFCRRAVGICDGCVCCIDICISV